MSKLSWYWHRLRAMTPGEMALHARKKLRQFADGRGQPDWSRWKLESSGAFPLLPSPAQAPAVLRDALRRDVEDILAGRWKAFGHLELKVDDPPRWHCDYLVGRDLATTESAFKLDHRALPGGADIKLIWELSRWYQLVRLAMAAHVLGDERAAGKCVDWLEDWVKHNPPYRGWNWTSALEVGMRLIQFTWIDALLGAPSSCPARSDDANTPSGSSALQTRLAALRQTILPSHAWYAWRHKSFGSSANNHLLGELVGCIVATARWPELAKWSAPLDELQRRWEHEVLAQFAEDGGNKEQALNYQLFSWEFCWQARAALIAAGRAISPSVEERLRRAARFFIEIQIAGDPWDYGDSDNAFVTPCFADETQCVAEWHAALRGDPSLAIRYWWQQDAAIPIADSPAPPSRMEGLIRAEESGQAVCRSAGWVVRLDTSALGYLRTAAHGHLDALHLSIWRDGVAMVVDPGTGCYYADLHLRTWLASRAAHNAPCPLGQESPHRLGPFLWASHHAPPGLGVEFEELSAGMCLPDEILERRFSWLPERAGFLVEDRCLWNNRAAAEKDELPFTVRWQFAPGTRLEDLGPRHFLVIRQGVKIEAKVSPDWAEVFCVSEQRQRTQADPDHGLAGLVSPSFRRTVWAPYLKLVARPQAQRRAFTTTFLTH